MEQQATAPKEIKLAEVVSLLKSGYTRWKKDVVVGHNPGSIEEHYGLKFSEMTELNKHPKLKRVRTTFPKAPKEPKIKAEKPKTFVIIDDIDEKTEGESPVISEQAVDQELLQN